MVNNTKNKAKAVVLGVNFASLGIARALSKYAIDVLAIDSNLKTPYAYSRYYRPNQCPDLFNDSLVDYLVELVKNESIKPVLFITNDENVRIVSKHRGILSNYYEINLPPVDVIDTLMNKRKFADFSKKEGFLIPGTFCVSSAVELESIANKIRYPCIMKPSVKDAIWIKSELQKAFKIRNADELVNMYKHINSITKDVILQEWAEGPDSNIYFCLVYYDSKSNLLAHFSGKKIRQWPPMCGNTSSAVSCDNRYILSETERLFTSVKYKGLGSLEFKLDSRDGRFKIIEPTVGRTNLQSAIASAGGTDLPYIAYCDATGRTVKIGAQVNNVTWIREDADLMSALYCLKKKDLNLLSWLKMLLGKKTLAIFKWDDPLPFLFVMIETARKVIKIIVKISISFIPMKTIHKNDHIEGREGVTLAK